MAPSKHKVPIQNAISHDKIIKYVSLIMLIEKRPPTMKEFDAAWNAGHQLAPKYSMRARPKETKGGWFP